MTRGNQKPFEDRRKEEKTYSAVNEEERQRDIIEQTISSRAFFYAEWSIFYINRPIAHQRS
jgi:hypothetical protein